MSRRLSAAKAPPQVGPRCWILAAEPGSATQLLARPRPGRLHGQRAVPTRRSWRPSTRANGSRRGGSLDELPLRRRRRLCGSIRASAERSDSQILACPDELPPLQRGPGSGAPGRAFVQHRCSALGADPGTPLATGQCERIQYGSHWCRRRWCREPGGGRGSVPQAFARMRSSSSASSSRTSARSSATRRAIAHSSPSVPVLELDPGAGSSRSLTNVSQLLSNSDAVVARVGVKHEDEPLGASLTSRGEGPRFTLLSRGDRLRGRLRSEPRLALTR